jgi:anti-sigma regulatory factor (Ser/Thr protein kinase)
VTTEPAFHSRIADTELTALPTAPGLARSFVRHTLRSWGLDALSDDAEIVVSELVTNAVKAMSAARRSATVACALPVAPVVIELRVHDTALRIAVRDGSPERPKRQVADDDAEGGRGLFLVEALSLRWDAFRLGSGKVTWAELALTPGAAP